MSIMSIMSTKLSFTSSMRYIDNQLTDTMMNVNTSKCSFNIVKLNKNNPRANRFYSQAL